jgi:hypothetical protein
MSSFVRRFLVWARGYFRENWGAPFVLGFMFLLLVAVVLLIVGLKWTAEGVANYAYFVLVVGVVLQLVCSLRRGNSSGEGAE